LEAFRPTVASVPAELERMSLHVIDHERQTVACEVDFG
jgi:hypothetical protein